jgi:hypothetical protein
VVEEAATKPKPFKKTAASGGSSSRQQKTASKLGSSVLQEAKSSLSVATSHKKSKAQGAADISKVSASKKKPALVKENAEKSESAQTASTVSEESISFDDKNSSGKKPGDVSVSSSRGKKTKQSKDESHQKAESSISVSSKKQGAKDIATAADVTKAPLSKGRGRPPKPKQADASESLKDVFVNDSARDTTVHENSVAKKSSLPTAENFVDDTLRKDSDSSQSKSVSRNRQNNASQSMQKLGGNSSNSSTSALNASNGASVRSTRRSPKDRNASKRPEAVAEKRKMSVSEERVFLSSPAVRPKKTKISVTEVAVQLTEDSIFASSDTNAVRERNEELGSSTSSRGTEKRKKQIENEQSSTSLVQSEGRKRSCDADTDDSGAAGNKHKKASHSVILREKDAQSDQSTRSTSRNKQAILTAKGRKTPMTVLNQNLPPNSSKPVKRGKALSNTSGKKTMDSSEQLSKHTSRTKTAVPATSQQSFAGAEKSQEKLDSVKSVSTRARKKSTSFWKTSRHTSQVMDTGGRKSRHAVPTTSSVYDENVC